MAASGESCRCNGHDQDPKATFVQASSCKCDGYNCLSLLQLDIGRPHNSTPFLGACFNELGSGRLAQEHRPSNCWLHHESTRRHSAAECQHDDSPDHQRGSHRNHRSRVIPGLLLEPAYKDRS
jgi:hypothetical protein